MPEPTAPVTVSCILLTYNHRPYVAEAVESVLMQKTDFPIELILADDGSTDGTRDVLSDYASRYPDIIRTCFAEKNMGGAALGNLAGSTMCRGKYLAIFDGDDRWLERDRLQTLVDWLETHPGYAGVAHLRERRDEAGNLLDYDPPKRLFGRDFTMRQFLNGERFSITGALCVNHYRLAGNRYRAIETAARNADDYQRCVIVHDFGKVFMLPRCFYSYRVIVRPGGVNYNSIMSDLGKYRDQIHILREMQAFYREKYDFSGEVRRWQAKHLLLALLKHNGPALQEVWADVEPRRRLITALYVPVYAVKRFLKIGEHSGWKIA